MNMMNGILYMKCDFRLAMGVACVVKRLQNVLMLLLWYVIGESAMPVV